MILRMIIRMYTTEGNIHARISKLYRNAEVVHVFIFDTAEIIDSWSILLFIPSAIVVSFVETFQFLVCPESNRLILTGKQTHLIPLLPSNTTVIAFLEQLYSSSFNNTGLLTA